MAAVFDAPTNPNPRLVRIAQMTPEEAERKRAGDRVNQRWSRARRAGKVAQLENQNADLKRQNEALRLQLAKADCELKLLRQNHDKLRTAVQAAHALVQSSEDGLIDGDEQTSSGATAHRTMPSESTTTVPPAEAYVSPASQSGYVVEDPSIMNDILLDLPLEFGTGLVVNLLDSRSSLNSSEWTTTDLSHDSSVSWAGSRDAATHASLAIEPEAGIRLPPLTTEFAPPWHLVPLHLPPTTALDHVLINAETGRQWSHQDGKLQEELSQGSFPSLSTLLIPSENDSKTHPISAVVSEHTTWGTTVVSFPSRVAYHYIVAHMLRWLVLRTEESFNQIPDSLKPTVTQLSVPHPAWIDMFPWSEGRDLIIREMDYSKFEIFQQATSTFSVNWPYNDSDMFITDPAKGRMVLNPVFETHIRDGKNWTFSPDLLEEFPFLGSCPSAAEKLRL
ncbi:hypothetical protein K491DRAFT_716487 [Lophiostoma macrostomum CBS 122681]|uniref:BZIP domain-containing protein n=1 Tax=Lophiostoma macrostomum CBS 122681 TaxID=1314788 RepID=A0A6A6T5T8_9PLEO|nr:hypothetical protein K491DRAFT_716487 [Lophiostoma macrostomum CBS 122681]